MKAAARNITGGAKRIAVHEAGHMVMALILGLDVERCAILSAGEDWRPGELGRCTVLVPDPVGLRRFLVSMGGVMAEESFYGEEKGGARDHRDAVLALQNFIAHYRDPDRRNDVEDLFHDVAELFHREGVLKVLEKSARLLHKHRVLERPQIASIAGFFPPEGELANIRHRLALLDDPPPAPTWRETLVKVLKISRDFILRFRKPFDESP